MVFSHQSDLKVSPLVFGGNVFGWTVDTKTSFSLIDAWLDAGLNTIDTADVYSYWGVGNQGGESETVIGQWLKAGGGRKRIVLATKVGKTMGEGLKGLSATYIKKAVEASLKRLQTDYIDLYFAHEDALEAPLEETLQAFAELVQEGKVRAFGASNYSAKRFAEALTVSEKLGIPCYEWLQPLFNLYDRQSFEDELQALCIDQKIGVINYFSLAAGFLTGKYQQEGDLQGRPREKHVKSEYFGPRGMRILNVLQQISQETGASCAAIALAWEMAQPGVTAPIVSATSVEQLEELLQAVSLKLESEQLQRLSLASELKE